MEITTFLDSVFSFLIKMFFTYNKYMYFLINIVTVGFKINYMLLLFL